MTCPRCVGLAIPEQLQDFEHSNITLDGWKCLCCGWRGISPPDTRIPDVIPDASHEKEQARMRKLREARLQQGLCPYCGKEPVLPGTIRGQHCANVQRDYRERTKRKEVAWHPLWST